MHHILVVEDERDLNDLLAEQLGKDGYRVSQAFDGQAGVNAVRAGAVDLVLLDRMLQGEGATFTISLPISSHGA